MSKHKQSRGSLWKLLKRGRAEAGMTLGQVAKTIGTREAHVCQWENGYMNPNVVSFIKLALLYSDSVDAFLRGEFKVNRPAAGAIPADADPTP